MEPANKSPLRWLKRAQKTVDDKTAVDFLPDADEIERRPLPREARITLHVLAAAVLCGVFWAVISEVDMIVVARGRLVTPLPNIVVQPLETSIIQTIEVRPGQIVKKGERLATLDPTFTEADEAQLRTRLHSLDNQLARLDTELAGKPVVPGANNDPDSLLQARLANERQASYRAQLRRVEETVARLRASLETNRRDQSSLASRVRVLKDMETMQEELVAQKYAVRSRLLEAQDRALEAERNLVFARNREQELLKELAAAEAEKASFETGWRQKLMEEVLTVSRDRDSVNEQLQKADKRYKLVVLTSPTDAVVLDIAKLSQGSVVREAEALFTLVPIGAELEAEVQIDSLDVGYVKLGDPVHIKFDAFPFQRHGAMLGTLRTVSEDAFRRENNPGAPDAFYTGRIKLGAARLNKMPEKARLLPGMTVSAEIVVGKRSVISYIVWPLVKALDESIREP